MLPDLLLQSYRPVHINFAPYSEEEIALIITARNPVDMTPLELQAVKFCSKKVSAKSGDARTALDLYKRALELSELDVLQSLRSESMDRSSCVNGPFTSPKSSPLPRVLSTPQLLARKMSQRPVMSSPSMKHVSRAIHEAEVKHDDPVWIIYRLFPL